MKGGRERGREREGKKNGFGAKTEIARLFSLSLTFDIRSWLVDSGRRERRQSKPLLMCSIRRRSLLLAICRLTILSVFLKKEREREREQLLAEGEDHRPFPSRFLALTPAVPKSVEQQQICIAVCNSRRNILLRRERRGGVKKEGVGEKAPKHRDSLSSAFLPFSRPFSLCFSLNEQYLSVYHCKRSGEGLPSTRRRKEDVMTSEQADFGPISLSLCVLPFSGHCAAVAVRERVRNRKGVDRKRIPQREGVGEKGR